MTNQTKLDEFEWDEPVSFETFDRPQFPIHAMPSVLKDMVNSVTDVTQTAIDASGVAILSMVSAAVARKFEVHLTDGDGWVEQNNLYTVIALPSGERKSAVFSHLIKPITAYERELQNRMMEEDIGPTNAPRRLARFLADDVTPQRLAELLAENHERMAVMSTEGGLFESLSHRHYGKPMNLDVYLKGFTWDPLDIDRKRSSPITLRKPALTMCIFVQPSLLQGLAARLTGRGLMGRFLFTVPETTRGRREIDLKTIATDVSQAYKTVITRLMEFDPMEPVKFELTQGAMDFFQEFRREFEPRLEGGGELSHEFLRTWTERLPGQILRIASLFHVANQAANGPISLETLDRAITDDCIVCAIELGEYFIEHAKAAFGCLKSNAKQDDAKHLLEVLTRKRVVIYKKQDLWSAVKGKFHTSDLFDSALDELKVRGFVRVDKVKAQRGRCGTRIECNPRMFPLEVKEPPKRRSEIPMNVT